MEVGKLDSYTGFPSVLVSARLADGVQSRPYFAPRLAQLTRLRTFAVSVWSGAGLYLR